MDKIISLLKCLDGFKLLIILYFLYSWKIFLNGTESFPYIFMQYWDSLYSVNLITAHLANWIFIIKRDAYENGNR